MKRLWRWVFNAMAVSSLGLCVATAVLWVRSYHPGESRYRVSENGWRDQDHFVMQTTGGLSVRGEIGWFSDRIEFDRPAKLWGLADAIESDLQRSISWHHNTPASHFPSKPQSGWSNALGFRINHFHDETQMGFAIQSDTRHPQLPWMIYDNRYVLFPHWFLLLACGVLPLRALVRAVRRFKHKPGHCRRCGYDLRATPDRCPECGAVPSAQGMTS